MGVYTKTGDKGQTSLYTGQRVDKDSLRVETYGTIDEMNSALGMARAFCENKDVQQLILALQRDIPSFMADLASIGTRPMINEYHIKDMEQEMDRIRRQLNKICIAETIICVVFMLSPIVVNDGVSVTWIRFGAAFVQLALIALVTFFFTKDKYFGKVVLACVICAVLSIGTTFLASAVIWFVIFNFIKLVWMMRVERVRYSWKEIAGQVVGKK